MLVEFNSLPDTSRVWIYQANRSFTEGELQEISTDLDEFLSQWTAHGEGLKCGYEIRYRRLVVPLMPRYILFRI